MAEKSGSLKIMPRLASSSCIVHILLKWVCMFPFSVQQGHLHSSIVIMHNCLLKSAFEASQASFTVGFPLIFKYKESGIIEAICWNTMACSCKYWFMFFAYLLITLTCSSVRMVDSVDLDGGSSGLVVDPSRWLYNLRAQIKNSSLSFCTMKPFPSAGSLRMQRKSLPSFRLKDICNKQYSDISSSFF